MFWANKPATGCSDSGGKVWRGRKCVPLSVQLASWSTPPKY
uniref:Uncharacterized protein n=1 Tax=Timema cristinae TaxID=61476 RepID=A0A7R9HB35_TIMCR|nr:unnamed protein product [Timema cristinae]